jgi:ATP-dependent Clp protease ATP-binding subunit ClpA
MGIYDPKILDVFLQILDGGRLTSGRGETVYFSESLIVFTSNLGMFEQLPDGAKHISFHQFRQSSLFPGHTFVQ